MGEIHESKMFEFIREISSCSSISISFAKSSPFLLNYSTNNQQTHHGETAHQGCGFSKDFCLSTEHTRQRQSGTPNIKVDSQSKAGTIDGSKM